MRVGVSGQSRAAGPVPGDSSGHVQTVQVAQLRMQLRMPHRRTASADPRVPARGGRVRSRSCTARTWARGLCQLGVNLTVTVTNNTVVGAYAVYSHPSRRVTRVHPAPSWPVRVRPCAVWAVWPGPWARGSAEQDPPAGPAQPPRLPGERETGGDRSFAAGRPRPRRSGGVRADALSSAASYVRSMWQHYS